MKVMRVALRMTADEYLTVPYDGRRTMLVEGEVVLNQPRNRHQAITGDLFAVLHAWARETTARGTVRMPLDVKLDERNVFGPDVLWYAEGRVPQLDDDRPYAVPDIAGEVRSPSTWRYDIGAKESAYERAGLAELWLVDTIARTILVFRRRTAGTATFDVALELAIGDELTSPQLPGFALAIGSLFAD
jgi:Uma2 family endonuclease